MKRVLILLFIEATIILAMSGLIALSYWLKTKYYPGPTLGFLVVGVFVSALLGGAAVIRGTSGAWAVLGSMAAGALAGAATLLLATGFVVNLLGS